MEFPSDPESVSRPPLLSLALMAKRIRQLRQMFPKGIPTEEERWHLVNYLRTLGEPLPDR